jgi:hypothetical protein
MLKLLTNKHMIIAMLVAPVLAVLAWFAVGEFAGEQAHKAEAGREYPLVEQSNCRYESGVCELRNKDMVIKLSLEQGAEEVLILRASHALEGVLLAIGPPESTVLPDKMRTADGRGKEWRMLIGGVPGPQERIRLVATAGGSAYFAEASTRFVQTE